MITFYDTVCRDLEFNPDTVHTVPTAEAMVAVSYKEIARRKAAGETFEPKQPGRPRDEHGRYTKAENPAEVKA